MAPYRPRLRADVTLQAEPDGSFALIDRVLNRGVGLDPVTLAVVRALDGRPLGEVLDDVERQALPRAEVENKFRQLGRLNLLDDAGAGIVARARALAGGGQLPPLTLPEARFACQASGGCCHGYTLGPLTSADVARLQALDLSALVTGPYLDEKKTPAGKTRHYLATVPGDEHCVFLQKDNLCGIHARFGAAAKPNFCQLYPLQAVATLDGLKVYDNGECASFSLSSRSGPLLAEQVPELRALLPAARFDLYHPVVMLTPGAQLDHGHFLRLTRALWELVGRGLGSAGDTVRAAAALSRRSVEALRDYPLGPGQPDATLDALVATEPSELYAAVARTPATPRQLSRVALVAGILHESIEPKLADATFQGSLYRQFADAIQLLRRVGLARAQTGRTLAEDDQRVLAITWGDDVEAALRTLLRYQLFSHRVLIDERMLPATLRLGIVHAVTILGAKLSAASARRSVVTLADFDRAHTMTLRILRLPVPMGVLVAYEDDAFDVMDAAPALVQ